MLTWTEIDLNAIKANLNAIKRKVGNRKVIAVIKADAYGHGVLRVAKAIAAQADMFAVATVDEAICLREAHFTLPILNLFCILSDQAEAVIKYNISQTVCSPDICKALSDCAKRMNAKANIHVKVNTGMNRIGVYYSEAAEFIKQIHSMPYLNLEGIYTHFACADEADKSYTYLQLERFNEVLAKTDFLHSISTVVNVPPSRSVKSFLIHTANSPAILDLPTTYFDAVRPGLILYGLYPSKEVSKSILLAPALSWKARITYIKRVGRGEKIGYGGIYATDEPAVIATLPVGYADGFRRNLSNGGEVLIKGTRARVVGRVCMDQIMCDITHIPNVKVGDEVVLIGISRDDEITADEVADTSSTISYEILCGIGKRVKRIYRGE